MSRSSWISSSSLLLRHCQHAEQDLSRQGILRAGHKLEKWRDCGDCDLGLRGLEEGCKAKGVRMPGTKTWQGVNPSASNI